MESVICVTQTENFLQTEMEQEPKPPRLSHVGGLQPLPLEDFFSYLKRKLIYRVYVQPKIPLASVITSSATIDDKHNKARVRYIPL